MNDYISEIKKIPILSEDETNRLLLEVKNGSEKARSLLIKHNMRAVLKIAHEYKDRINMPIEDIVGMGSFGLIDAIDEYSYEKEVSIISFIYVCVRNRLNKVIQAQMTQKRSLLKSVSLNAPLYTGEDEYEITYEELISEESISNKSLYDIVETNIRNDFVLDAVNKLNKRDREVIKWRFGFDEEPKTLEEVAEILGVTREWVRIIEVKALKTLRNPKILKKLKDFY